MNTNWFRLTIWLHCTDIEQICPLCSMFTRLSALPAHWDCCVMSKQLYRSHYSLAATRPINLNIIHVCMYIHIHTRGYGTGMFIWSVTLLWRFRTAAVVARTVSTQALIYAKHSAFISGRTAFFLWSSPSHLLGNFIYTEWRLEFLHNGIYIENVSQS